MHSPFQRNAANVRPIAAPKSQVDQCRLARRIGGLFRRLHGGALSTGDVTQSGTPKRPCLALTEPRFARGGQKATSPSIENCIRTATVNLGIYHPPGGWRPHLGFPHSAALSQPIDRARFIRICPRLPAGAIRDIIPGPLHSRGLRETALSRGKTDQKSDQKTDPLGHERKNPLPGDHLR